VQLIDTYDVGVARAFLRSCRLGERGDIVDRSGSVARKIRDLLRDTIFKNAEIRRVKSADVVTFFIGDDDRDEDLLHVEMDYGILGEQGPGSDDEAAFRHLHDDLGILLVSFVDGSAWRRLTHADSIFQRTLVSDARPLAASFCSHSGEYYFVTQQ
jgi:hypothetical protein